MMRQLFLLLCSSSRLAFPEPSGWYASLKKNLLPSFRTKRGWRVFRFNAIKNEDAFQFDAKLYSHLKVFRSTNFWCDSFSGESRRLHEYMNLIDNANISLSCRKIYLWWIHTEESREEKLAFLSSIQIKEIKEERSFSRVFLLFLFVTARGPGIREDAWIPKLNFALKQNMKYF